MADGAAGPPRGPSDLAPVVPVRPTRSRTGRLLRDVAQQLADAAQILADDPSPEAVQAAVVRLNTAREALALVSRERAGREAATPPAPTPALTRRVQLALDSSSASDARSFTAEACAAWSVPDGVASSAVDVASELVTNAVAHARTVVVLALELRTDGLVVSTWDDGAGNPRMLPYRPGVSERGLGLRLVQQLSEQWGWGEEQDGKWVWARLAVTGAAASGSGRRPRGRRLSRRA